MNGDWPLIGVSVGTRIAAGDGLKVIGEMPTYTRAVALGGGAPVMVPVGIGESALRAVYEQLDGLLISGGGDLSPACYGMEQHPQVQGVDAERDAVELQLIHWALDDDKPLLGVCRGLQAINVALGGALFQDIPSEVPDAQRHDWFPGFPLDHIAHRVTVDQGSALQAALGATDAVMEVNSLHHQAIRAVASGLHVVARAEDGIIEGIEAPDRGFALGVQWHPELMLERHPPMRCLFEALAQAARSWAAAGGNHAGARFRAG
jgi:putative glutamine amidotransferase